MPRAAQASARARTMPSRAGLSTGSSQPTGRASHSMPRRSIRSKTSFAASAVKRLNRSPSSGPKRATVSSGP